MKRLAVRVKDGFSAGVSKKLSRAGTLVPRSLAMRIAEDTAPFVPARSGAFSARTQVVENRIVYPGPCAKVLYNGMAMVDRDSGKGPARIGTKNGAEVFRFRNGARLKTGNKPLVFSKKIHPLARDHWFEASKSRNLQNWLRVAGKAVEYELK